MNRTNLWARAQRGQGQPASPRAPSGRARVRQSRWHPMQPSTNIQTGSVIGGRPGMAPGDHHDAQAGLVEADDGVRHVDARRLGECDQAEKTRPSGGASPDGCARRRKVGSVSAAARHARSARCAVVPVLGASPSARIARVARSSTDSGALSTAVKTYPVSPRKLAISFASGSKGISSRPPHGAPQKPAGGGDRHGIQQALGRDGVGRLRRALAPGRHGRAGRTRVRCLRHARRSRAPASSRSQAPRPLPRRSASPHAG